MHVFDAELSLKDNFLKAADIEFAAWKFAGHEHREEFRNSGQSPQHSAWLRVERLRTLIGALANGELLAFGISRNDPTFEICQLPENLFLSADLRADGDNSTVSGMGCEFANVRICHPIPGMKRQSATLRAIGRPNHLPVIHAAWAALKSEIPNFVEWDKTSQNREIRKKVSELFPGKFPGNTRIGETTIRRHRSRHSDLFD